MADEFDANLKHLGEDFTVETPNTDESATDDTNTETSNSEETQQQSTEKTVGEEQAPAAKDSNSGKPDSGKQQGKETQGQKPSGPKDLTLADGSVVKAGAERRFYEQLQISKQQLAVAHEKATATTRDLQQAQQELQTLRQTAQQLAGVPLEQQAIASRLYQDLARDPVGTATKILAELKAKGYSIDGIGGAVDTAAIQQMLQNQSRQTENQQQGPTAEQVELEAQTEVGQFFAKYPDAVLHDEILAEIVTRNPGIDLQEAYFQLRSSVINRGLDWSQPIRPQLQATQQQQQQNQRQPAPMLNGRNNITPIVEEQMNFSSQGGETTDDIVRAAMADAGYGQRR